MRPFKVVPTPAYNDNQMSEPASMAPLQVIKKAISEGESVDYEAHEQETVDGEAVIPLPPAAPLESNSKPFRLK